MFGRDSSFFIPIAVLLSLVLGLMTTFGLFVVVRHFECERIRIDLQQQTNLHMKSVVDGFDTLVYVLDSINRLFVTVDLVSSEQFHTFAEPILQQFPYIQTLGFQRRISVAQQPVLAVEMRKHLPEFSLQQSSDDKSSNGHDQHNLEDDHWVIDYIEPKGANETALRLDAVFHQDQKTAMARARDTGLASATDLFTVTSEKNISKFCFTILMADYQRGVLLPTQFDRRRTLLGYASVMLRVGDFVDDILIKNGVKSQADVNLRVYVGDVIHEQNLVYSRGEQFAVNETDSWWPIWLFYDAPHNISQAVEFAGKHWRIEVFAPTRLFFEKNTVSILVLILGGLLSFGGTAYLYFLSMHSKRIEHLIDVRTQQMQQATKMMQEDIVARKRVEDAFQLRERAIESSVHAIIITNATHDHAVEYVNPAFERITGYAASEIIGRDFALLHGMDQDQAGIEEIRIAFKEKSRANAVFRCYRKDGTLFWIDLHTAPVKDSYGEVNHFVTAIYDITEMKRYQAELEHQARHDTLTGLVNRHVLNDRLSQAIRYGELYGHRVWVVFIDLDRFKFVNDTLGHNAGDLVLKEVASRLKVFTREADTIARLGSDEFVLILPERIEEELNVGLIQRMMEAIAQPLQIEGYDFFLSCSVGVAVYPNDGEIPDSLLKHADIAMYRAKEMGNNNYQFYTAAMNERALERLRIEGDLRNALERHELVLYYQPRVDLRTGRVVGMEALIRWMHPQLGMISPARFINLAEETGLIIQIGAWVIRTACEQNKIWQRMGLGYLRMSVNLSIRQFYQQNLLQSVVKVLEETGMAAHYLEIELTESLVMTDVDLAVGILTDLKEIGVQLSIDDFGTGYSSLSYLKSFPINTLKIDQSFVRDITIDQDDAAIVASIISLAHNLRLHVIAEGVETQEQLSYLQRHRCDEMQGFYFSGPMSADETEMMLRQGKTLP